MKEQESKDGQWQSSHEADCVQTNVCENITFPSDR